MITEIEPYLVNKRFNSELFDGLDGYYTNSLQFYPLDEMASVNGYMSLVTMMRFFSNTDFISIGALTSQSVMKGGIITRKPPVLILSYPLAHDIENQILTKLKDISILGT